MHLTTTFCVPCGSAPLGTFDAMNVYSLYFSIPIFFFWQGVWLRPRYRVHFPFRAPVSFHTTEFTFLSGRLSPSMLQSSLTFQGSCLRPYYRVHFPFRAPVSFHTTEFTFLSGRLTPSMLQSSLSFQSSWLRPCYKVYFHFRAPDSVHGTEFSFLTGLLTPSMLQSSLFFQGSLLRPCYKVHFPFRKYESDINLNVTNCQPESFLCLDFSGNLCLMITIASNQHGTFMKTVFYRKAWQYLTNKLIPLFEVKFPHLFHKRTVYIIVMHIDFFKAWYLSFSLLQDMKCASKSNFAVDDFHSSLLRPPLLSCEHCKHIYCSRLAILLPAVSEK